MLLIVYCSMLELTILTCVEISFICTFNIYQQMQWLLVMPILDLALAQSTWMMLAAVAERLISLTVLEVLLSTVTEATQRMLECDVKV